MRDTAASEQGYSAGFATTKPACEPQAFLFDLDGTLLDTLPDLVVLVNHTLANHNQPERSAQEVLSYVGDGARALMQRAFPPGTPDETIDSAFREFKELYAQEGIVLTKAYPGVESALHALRAANMKTGVLSNKYEGGVHDVVDRFFPGLLDASHGEREADGIPRKPAPDGLLLLAEELGVDVCRCLYFGDSRGDMQAAVAAGMTPIGCTWGYQSSQQLLDGGATALVEAPTDFLHFLP